MFHKELYINLRMDGWMDRWMDRWMLLMTRFAANRAELHLVIHIVT